MKREFLKAIEGLTDEAIDKIMAENGKDIEAEKAKTTALKAENDKLKENEQTLKDKITELSENASSAEDFKKEIETLKQTIKDRDDAEKAKQADAELTAAIVATFGDKEFTSDYVRNGIIADMKAEIAKPENKGKGYAEIFEGLTKDKEGIFANPNPPGDMAGMGYVPPDATAIADARAVMGLPPEK